MEAVLETPLPTSRLSARLVAVVGVASFGLLLASFKWAHHWGPSADTLVAAWAVAVFFSLVGGIVVVKAHPRQPEAGERVKRYIRTRRRLAAVGIVFGFLSVLALIAASVAFAIGIDPVAACGGG